MAPAPAGHLLSTAEVESALVEHEAVAEAAVVGRPHPIKGESLYCFVTLREGVSYSRALEAELKKQGGRSLLLVGSQTLKHFIKPFVLVSQFGRRSAPSPRRTTSRTLRDSPRPDLVKSSAPQSCVTSCPGAVSPCPDVSAGKIMRRVLRKIACDERDLGDISTLADTSVVEELFQNRCYTAV